MDEKRKAGEGEGAACGIVENGEGGDCRNCRPGTGPWDFMTERETTVLKAMRALRGRATEVKNRIRRLKRGHPKGPDGAENERLDSAVELDVVWEQEVAEELLQQCQILSDLRQQWQEMTEERMAAQEERMRLLGHVQ